MSLLHVDVPGEAADHYVLYVSPGEGMYIVHSMNNGMGECEWFNKEGFELNNRWIYILDGIKWTNCLE
jgi:hypothetical protein